MPNIFSLNMNSILFTSCKLVKLHNIRNCDIKHFFYKIKFPTIFSIWIFYYGVILQKLSKNGILVKLWAVRALRWKFNFFSMFKIAINNFFNQFNWKKSISRSKSIQDQFLNCGLFNLSIQRRCTLVHI